MNILWWCFHIVLLAGLVAAQNYGPLTTKTKTFCYTSQALKKPTGRQQTTFRTTTSIYTLNLKSTTTQTVTPAPNVRRYYVSVTTTKTIYSTTETFTSFFGVTTESTSYIDTFTDTVTSTSTFSTKTTTNVSAPSNFVAVQSSVPASSNTRITGKRSLSSRILSLFRRSPGVSTTPTTPPSTPGDYYDYYGPPRYGVLGHPYYPGAVSCLVRIERPSIRYTSTVTARRTLLPTATITTTLTRTSTSTENLAAWTTETVTYTYTLPRFEVWITTETRTETVTAYTATATAYAACATANEARFVGGRYVVSGSFASPFSEILRQKNVPSPKECCVATVNLPKAAVYFWSGPGNCDIVLYDDCLGPRTFAAGRPGLGDVEFNGATIGNGFCGQWV